MKKKQTKKLGLYKSTLTNLTQSHIRAGLDAVFQLNDYPSKGCDTKRNTCYRKCTTMVSVLHECNSIPADGSSCYTEVTCGNPCVQPTAL
jgi:hypothetical protein